eukprot:3131060-Amphidinium_carterae.1
MRERVPDRSVSSGCHACVEDLCTGNSLELSRGLTASDASESGGELTFASNLTHASEEEARRLEMEPVAWGRDKIMFIAVNDEAGSTRMDFQGLGLEVLSSALVLIMCDNRWACYAATTGGLLPDNLQKQLHGEWLEARVMLLYEAVPVH